MGESGRWGLAEFLSNRAGLAGDEDRVDVGWRISETNAACSEDATAQAFHRISGTARHFFQLPYIFPSVAAPLTRAPLVED